MFVPGHRFICFWLPRSEKRKKLCTCCPEAPSATRAPWPAPRAGWAPGFRVGSPGRHLIFQPTWRAALKCSCSGQESQRDRTSRWPLRKVSACLCEECGHLSWEPAPHPHPEAGSLGTCGDSASDTLPPPCETGTPQPVLLGSTWGAATLLASGTALTTVTGKWLTDSCPRHRAAPR